MKTYRAGLGELVRPNISVGYPKRKGQHLLELAGKTVFVLCICGASFWLGQQFPSTSSSSVEANSKGGMKETATIANNNKPALSSQDREGEIFQDKELDGLHIQTFILKADALVPGKLAYELELTNSGAKLVGEMKLVIQGELEGKSTTWTYPDDARPTDQHIRLNVSRYLKTSGALQLPSKFMPQKAALKLQQENGVRASRVVSLAGNANNGLPYR